MQIRPATVADLPALTALYAHLIPEEAPCDLTIAKA